MTSSLANIIRQGTALQFNQAIEDLLESGESVPSLEGQTFSDLELDDFHFQGLDFTNVAFENCTLTDIIFEGCLLDGALFHSSTLLQSHFTDIKSDGLALDGCTLSRCKVASVVADNCEWSDCQFNDCDLIQLCGDDVILERLTFRGGHWQEVYFGSGECSYLTLRSLKLTGVGFDKLDIGHCYYYEVDTVSTDLPSGFLEKTGRRKTL